MSHEGGQGEFNWSWVLQTHAPAQAQAQAQALRGRIMSVNHFRAEAKRILPKPLYEYVCSGAEDEQTLQENEASFKRVFLRPRVMRNVSRLNLSVTVLNTNLSMPIFVSPAGVHKLMHPDGELATARSCADQGILLGVSQHSTTSLEDIASVASGPKWFQIYILIDRLLTRDIVRRAEKAGYSAIILTVDSPIFGFREADFMNDFSGLPTGLSLANYPRTHTAWDERKEQAWDQNTDALLDTSLTWTVISELRNMTSLPVIVKGIMTHEDAVSAVKAGCDGIIVSNHGGRQLDGCLGSLAVLPDVVAAVRSTGREIPVLLDGGVRRGTDVLKALALGAAAVGLGKPVFWALAVGGQEGVQHLMALLRRELEAAMRLCGVEDVAHLPPNLVTNFSPLLSTGCVYKRSKL